MTTKEIAKIVNEKGLVGCTDRERYLDIPDVRTTRRTYAQIVSFNDDRPLALYWLNDKSDGSFSDYRKVSRKTKEKVEEYLMSL